MKRTAFLIDGFNLYHSIEDIRKSKGVCLKWLDLHALCKSFMYLFGRDYDLYKIFYFTAIAYHYRDDDKTKRHEDYIKCLESKGIEVIRGRFKEKPAYCPLCSNKYVSHEEKETDIAISSKLLELLCANDHTHCDGFCLVTGDSDLVPAIKTALRIAPAADIRFAFPVNRKSEHLLDLAPKSFKLREGHYRANQFRKRVKLTDGTFIKRPASWS